ncbi:CoA-transferase family III protein [Candidatus Nanopelagicus hibericus]|uniref:CoA-transferase family III protein n=1 Tax=Candidatus Nanopelagicus hibericus TaxID=1884915 RepID=A0A249K8V7_9ACTN|nr:CaiB/BaiF CoA-transferase family protein [Candidatus Nanopelagicus hibericus]ASY13159.1 CoA-transferase family III protein [Candidatus Nanopelagicus hibericus]
MEATKSDKKGALSELRVIDATQMLAGPIAGTRLGDLGADVIKVEPPASGEFNRTRGFEDQQSNGEMTTFLAVNRNKRSLAVDLKSIGGKEVIYELVKKSDVFLQNFRFGTADRLGIGYEDLKKINPGIIYCSISGYGSFGPYRDRPGQDLVVQGYSGSMFSVGAAGDDPTPSALWGADVMTGYQAVIGVLAAIESRHHTGVGQHVEVDMLSVVMDCQLQELVTFLNAGPMPRRLEERSAHGSIPAPYGVYKTKDGWLTLAMVPLPILGEILNDDWLKTLTSYNDGHKFRNEVYKKIRKRFTDKTTQEWIDICDAAGAWCGPVYNYEDLVNDVHIKETNYIVEQPQFYGGSAKTVRPPIRMNQTPPSIRRGAPALGEHTQEILSNLLEMNAEKITQLISSGAVSGVKE